MTKPGLHNANVKTKGPKFYYDCKMILSQNHPVTQKTDTWLINVLCGLSSPTLLYLRPPAFLFVFNIYCLKIWNYTNQGFKLYSNSFQFLETRPVLMWTNNLIYLKFHNFISHSVGL